MSHVSSKVKEGWIPCEFATMHACLNTDDEEFCRTFKDPQDCASYHRRMILEGEETQDEYQAWLNAKGYSLTSVKRVVDV